jgi:diguanylate cyclase (GGDEF)-like protein
MWGITDELFIKQPTFRELINFNRYNDINDLSEENFDTYLNKRETDVGNDVAVPEELHRKDGLVYQYQCVVLPDGGRMLTYFNITNHKNTQAQLAKNLEEVHELANRDPLTGLPNLRMLHERFLSNLAMSKRNGWKVAVMFIDLDGFKGVNDTYGHIIGDMILKMVAQLLLNIVRKADTVGRIGGDELLILQTEVREEGVASHVANKIIHQMSEPFELAGNKIKIGASIGIAIHPTHGESLAI